MFKIIKEMICVERISSIEMVTNDRKIDIIFIIKHWSKSRWKKNHEN
jgi:hypothetical protein